MKRFLSVLLIGTFVLGFAAVASAVELTAGGDARVRGAWFTNVGFVKDSTDSGIDQRFRLMLNAKEGDVMFKTRLSLSNSEWNGTKTTGGVVDAGVDVDVDGDGVDDFTDSDTTSTVVLDHAYLVFPVGMVTVDVGRQPVNFGTKFVTWDAIKDRLKVTAKLDAATVGAWVDKDTETHGDDNPATAEVEDEGGFLQGDKDTFGVFGSMPLGEMKGAARLWLVRDETGSDKGGFVINPVVMGKVGGMDLAAEFAYQGGKAYEDAKENARMGLVGVLGIPMDPMTVTVAAAYAANGFAASSYFEPTLLFGTNQATAIVNFGAAGDDSAFALIGGVDYKVSDKLGAGAKVAYASLSSENSTSLIEVDAGVKYAIAKNLGYALDLAVGMPNDDLGDENLMVVAHKVEFAF